MSRRKCGLCGKDPAEGFATINGEFFCHGDLDPVPTCYMQSQWRFYTPSRAAKENTR